MTCFTGTNWTFGVWLMLAGGCQTDTPETKDDDTDAPPVPTGLSWGEGEVVATGGQDDLYITFNNTPIAVRDSEETLHSIWLDGSDIIYGRRDGTGWATTMMNRLGVGGVAKPTLGVVGDDVIVVWLEGVANKMQVVAAYSSDGGGTWQTSMQLSSDAGKAVNPSLHMLSNHSGQTSAVVAWGNEISQQIVGSTWEGTTWEESEWSLGDISSSPTEARDVGVRGWGDVLYASWEEDSAGGRTRPLLFGAKSTDGGLTWGDPEPVNATDENFGGDPSVVFLSEENIWVAYQDKGAVYWCRSDDGGVSFADNIRLGDGLFAHVDGAANGVVATAWEHFKGNMKDNSIKTVGLHLSLDRGVTAEGPHVMPGSEDVFHTLLGTVAISPLTVDVMYISKTEDESSLIHRSAEIQY